MARITRSVVANTFEARADFTSLFKQPQSTALYILNLKANGNVRSGCSESWPYFYNDIVSGGQKSELMLRGPI